jgi:hypothetical protein
VTSSPLTTTCSRCASTHFLKDGECVQACPAGTWLNELTRHCIECPVSCETCDDANRCTTCKDGFHLGFNFMCETCVKANCKVCTLTGSIHTCTECNDGFFKDVNGDCVSCANGCETCTAADQCTNCESGWFPLHTPASGSSVATTICTQCGIAHCDECDTADTCRTCAPQHFL